MEGLAQQLRSKGLRNTPQRRAVLAALAGAPHATAADLTSVLSAAGVGGPSVLDGMSRQGLYNVLDDLTKAGLVRCIEPAGSPARYELRVGDNHHHLVCRDCGRIEDVSCVVGAAPCLEPGERRGFEVDEAEIIWWGRCADCATAARTR